MKSVNAPMTMIAMLVTALPLAQPAAADEPPWGETAPQADPIWDLVVCMRNGIGADDPVEAWQDCVTGFCNLLTPQSCVLCFKVTQPMTRGETVNYARAEGTEAYRPVHGVHSEGFEGPGMAPQDNTWTNYSSGVIRFTVSWNIAGHGSC